MPKPFHLVRAAVIASAMLASAVLAIACGADETAADSPAIEPTELSVEEVARRIEAGEAVAVDANSDQTRESQGTLPSAVLLTSSGSFDAGELPADHDTCLVFYCANEQCAASEGAANRAHEQGYSNVNVMRAGIAGWVEAGQPVDHPAS